MKLDCVLTAVNENVLYLDFVPIFIKTWNKLYPDVDVKIILIAKTIPESFKIYKDNIILFEPLENVLTSFTSQFIRNLYPCILDYKNGVMITDMDMLPMNSTYYTKNILEFDNNKFINYRGNLLFKKKQLFMCYNVATPKIWKDIFKINSTDDIVNIIKDVSNNNTIKKGHGNTGWSIDQITLYRKVMDWNKKTNNLICLKDNQTKFKRLDRNKFNISNVNIRNNVTLGKYTDYHCYRPMSKHSKTNWEIFNLLPTKINYISGHEFYNKLNIIPIMNPDWFNKYAKGYVKEKFIINSKIPIVSQKIEISKLVNPIFLLKYSCLQYFYTNILSQLQSKFVLVTCFGDETLPENKKYYRKDIINHSLLHKWYSTNMNFNHERVACIPVGLENKNWNRVKTHLIEEYKNNEKTKLLYLNFNLKTHSSRKYVLNKLLNSGFTMNKKLPWNDYIKELSQHKFCISPRGNGIDCHRHWECLYLGVIPIVQRSIVIDSIKELPILIVDNYDNITEEYLHKKYNEMKKKTYCLNKLYIDYWINKIKSFDFYCKESEIDEQIAVYDKLSDTSKKD